MDRSKAVISQFLKGKIQVDNKNIDAGMAEAKQKAQNQMDAASASLQTGIVGGLNSIGDAFSQLKLHASGIRNQVAQNSLGHVSPEIESRYQALVSLLNEHASAGAKQNANELQIKVNQQEQKEAQQEDSKKDAADHYDLIRDSILDFLRKMSEADPKL